MMQFKYIKVSIEMKNKQQYISVEFSLFVKRISALKEGERNKSVFVLNLICGFEFYAT
jgi:hypothetical protein